MKALSLELRRDGVLLSDGASDTLLEGRAAALFTYLAAEGPTSRRALSALLWPDSDPKRARANLRKLLSRLGPWRDALTGPDPLSLRADLMPQAWAMVPERLHADAGPELELWLEEARERRRQRRIRWLRDQLARHEAAGDRSGALASAEELLSEDPVDATARQVLALAGRLDAAPEGLSLFRRHERRLAREFDAAPDDATRTLAEDLARDADAGALALLVTEGARLHGPDAATAIERIDAARPAWSAAWERAVAQRDAGALAGASDALSDYFEIRGEIQSAVTLLTRAQLALDPSDDTDVRRAAGRLLVHLAWHEQSLGVPTAAVHAERGLALLSPDDDPALYAQALYASGRALWAGGDVEGARERWDQAHARLEGADDGLRAGYLHGNVAMAADVLGERRRAIRHYRSALEIVARHGAEAAATSYLNNLGQLLVEEGALEEGVRLLDRGIELARSHDQPATLAYLLDSRSRASLAAGSPEDAREHLAESEQLARSCSDRVLTTSILTTRARIALSEGGEALGLALAALRSAREVGLRSAVLENLLVVADALRAARAPSDADRILATLAQAEGSEARAARERLGGRDARPAGDVDALAAALVGP